MSIEAGVPQMRIVQLLRERKARCGRRLFMQVPEKRGVQGSFLKLTSIFVLPPNLNQQNIGYAVPVAACCVIPATSIVFYH